MLAKRAESCIVCDVMTKWEFPSVEHAGISLVVTDVVSLISLAHFCLI